MREPERVFELTSEPWLLQGTPPTPLFRAELFNVNGVSHQMLGRMSQAYDSFSNAMKELQELPLETAHQLEGNLSFYFTTLGDMPTSYMYAQRALDNAIVADYAEATAQDTSDETTDVANEGNGKEKIEKDESVIEISQSQAMDMMQLAQISWRTGQEKQALDWMGRALRFGRRDGNSAITTGVFRIAADIALSNNWPDLALQFLDEAMLGTNELTWKTEGGAVFLLYAKALSAKHDQRQAIELLKVSAKFSKDVDPTVHCRALYSISRIMRDLNDSAEALKYARLAFEGLTSARRSVGVEEQKFSFLSDKKTIASWLLHLLIETNQDSMQLLHAIESWKMRTFLDLHDEKMAGLAAPLTETELSSRLSAILNDDDLLLDYVELDSSAIVLAVTKHQGIQVHTIKASPTDTAALRTKVLRGFDIRERSSLAAIRSGNVDSELDDSLRKLYSEILGPIQIPNNIKRLIIAPDEFLFGVPWPALKPSDTAYLTDRYEIVLIPSAVVAIAVNNSRPEQARYQRSLIACALGGVESSEMEDRVSRRLIILRSHVLVVAGTNARRLRQH
jgi:hypothetical protein